MVVGDLCKESDAEKVINETIEHFKQIDILVCATLFITNVLISLLK